MITIIKDEDGYHSISDKSVKTLQLNDINVHSLRMDDTFLNKLLFADFFVQ